MASTVVNGYLSREKLQAAVSDKTSTFIEAHDRAINSTSRLIDKWCGRFFWRETTAIPRLFRATDRTSVCVGDFADTAGIVVETDDDGDGVFETVWDDDDWQAEPFVRDNDEPYRHITTTTRQREFPLAARRAQVRITLRRGWLYIPGPVEQASQVLATFTFRTKDQLGLDIGIDRRDTETVSADPISFAMKLVEPYAVRGGLLWTPPTDVGCC